MWVRPNVVRSWSWVAGAVKLGQGWPKTGEGDSALTQLLHARLCVKGYGSALQVAKHNSCQIRFRRKSH